MTHKSIISRLTEDLGMPRNDVERIVRTAPHRYKIFQIPKRQPGQFRTIAQPAYELKIMQRWMVSNLITKLPVHDSVMAYKVGCGIRKNALAHAKNPYLMKLDFRQFFPSIKPSDLFLHLDKYHKTSLSNEDSEVIRRLLFWKKYSLSDYELCIGAPSSPAVSNTVMYDFDEEVSRFCDSSGVSYTRYADDLTFSSNSKVILPEVLSFIRSSLKNIKYPRLTLNEEKTVFASKRCRRVVTGLVLSSQGDVSLGRNRKRLISARVHAFSMGKLSVDEALNLKGHLAFALDVEPEFVGRIRCKYGEDVIAKIFSVKKKI